MRIDTFLEWFVIFVGIVLAVGIIWPVIFELTSEYLSDLIPHPDIIAEWLREHGL